MLFRSYRSAVEGLERVELAHYAVSTYVIEDPELLEQAKALLADIDPAGAGETADVEYGSPGITLFRSGPEGQDILMGYSYQLQIGHSGGVRVVRFLEGEPSSQHLAPCEVVGCLPDNAYERLAELAGQQENQTGSGSPELSRFLAGVERATAIRYGPPSYSSWFCPYPIADEDLLAAAKEVLNSAVSLGPDDPEPDRGTLIHASVITLMLEDGEEIYYTLQRQDDCTYILEGAVSWFEDSGQSPWYSAAYRCEGDAVSVLENLARQQTGGGSHLQNHDLNRFFAELGLAVSIWAGSPTQPHYPAPVTDSDLVAMIRDHLSTFVLPEEGGILPTPEELTSVNQLVLSDGKRESLYTLAMWNNYTWLIPGNANLEEVQKIEYGDIFRSAEEINIGGIISSSVVLQTFD